MGYIIEVKGKIRDIQTSQIYESISLTRVLRIFRNRIDFPMVQMKV